MDIWRKEAGVSYAEGWGRASRQRVGTASAKALRPYAEIAKGLVQPTTVKTLLWP